MVPVRDRTAVSIEEALISRIITRHSYLEVLFSDNPPECVREVFKMIYEVYEIRKCEVHEYKPSSNGTEERVNCKIKDVL